MDNVIWDSAWTWACTWFVGLSLCALQWCMFLACTLQVYTHTHISLSLSLPYKPFQTHSPPVCELYVQSPEEQLYRCFLPELSERTHWGLCLCVFLCCVCAYVCVCVYMCERVCAWEEETPNPSFVCSHQVMGYFRFQVSVEFRVSVVVFDIWCFQGSYPIFVIVPSWWIL